MLRGRVRAAVCALRRAAVLAYSVQSTQRLRVGGIAHGLGK
jgi:hypothetical protein